MRVPGWASPALAWTVLAVGVVGFAYLVFLTLTLWSPAPLVDGWPVYSRMLRHTLGEVGPLDYLLQPHGSSHPHSIVYAAYWVDWKLFGARQILPHVLSVGSSALLAMLMAWTVFRAVGKDAPVMAALGAAGTLTVMMTVAVEVLAPFQIVLTASRLAYIAVLFGFINILRRDQRLLDYILLAVACPLVTFHGSGLLFGLLVAGVHLLLARSWIQCLAGLAPLASSILYSMTYVNAAASEVTGVSNLLRSLDADSIGMLVSAGSAYYTAPLIPFFLAGSGPVNETLFSVIGGVVAFASVGWAMFVVVTRKHRSNAELALAAASFFVALSAATAAVAIVSRMEIGAGQAATPVQSVLVSTRYAAVAVLAYAVCLAAALLTPWRALRPAGALVAAGFAATLWMAGMTGAQQRARLTEDLNIATSGVIAGSYISDEPGSWLWPGLLQDWYWPEQLRRLVTYMNEHQIGYAADLPRVGEVATNRPSVPLRVAGITPTTLIGMCAIDTEVPIVHHDILKRPHFLAVTDQTGKVIGAIAIRLASGPHRAYGYIRCRGNPESIKPSVLLPE